MNFLEIWKCVKCLKLLKCLNFGKFREISEVLEMEENAVRVNLMRARQKVKEQITQLMNYEQRQFSR